MSRENAKDKAVRLLATGNVAITRVEPNRVTARVRGDGTFHRVTYQYGEWACTCPSVTKLATCSHARAVRLVVSVDIARTP